ncbi:MAG TPA: hypothetical protein VFB45_10470 [Pseudolabrys sp.]|nr:hypothetical protein [Pseudolabrys sp.]
MTTSITRREPDHSRATKFVMLAGAVAILFTALCIAGVILRYSPLPLGEDDWNGYVAFNLDVLQRKVSAWWAPDEVHRLLLPRIILWLDFHIFGARLIFILVANFLMRLAILAILMMYARDLIKNGSRALLYTLFCILCFAWIQATALYHGWVGTPYFMALLFPLLAFYWLHCAKTNPSWFAPAALAGFASIATLANGLLVLPIMAVMAAITGFGAKRTFVLAALAVVAFVLYFWGFHYPEAEARPDAGSFILFTLTYLGNPFYYAVYYWLAGLQHAADVVLHHGSVLVSKNYLDYPGSRTSGLAAAVISGGVFVTVTAIITWRWLWTERTDSGRAALLASIGFIIATAAMAALGRAAYGFDYAVQERYTTGSLLAWQMLALLLVTHANQQRARRILMVVVVLVPLALLPDQLKSVLKPDALDTEARELARQALDTGHSEYPFMDRQVKRLKQMGIELPR